MASPEEPRFGAHRCPVGSFHATLRWTEWGPADGDPVVCVHGLTRTGRDFDALARRLARAGRRVICPDVFGRGMSDWLPAGALYVVPTYAAAMLPMLAAIGRPYDWVGTSMGGIIGMAVAATPGTNIRRLVLNDIGPHIPAAALAHIAGYLGNAMDFAGLAEVEAHLRRIHAPFGPLTDVQWRHLAATSARVTAAGRMVLHYDPAIAEPARYAAAADAVMWPIWDAFSRPTLVLRGESSGLLLPDTLARMTQKPGVRAEIIAGCGHAPALMDDAQTEMVSAFLAA